MTEVSAARGLPIQANGALALVPGGRQDGPVLGYVGRPPVLQGRRVAGPGGAPGYVTIFTLLGQRAWTQASPGELPLPGERTFTSALSSTALSEGTVAEAYSLALRSSDPDFVTVIEVTAHHSDYSLTVDYATYSRQCK